MNSQNSLYIHVPFCHRKCYYCDFYSLGSGRVLDSYAQLIADEMVLHRNFLPGNKISTIYIGGGTPSMLSYEQIKLIVDSAKMHFDVENDAEITIEVNPDDITSDKLLEYKHIGINRISMGVQSFIDSELKQIGRLHNAQQAIDAIGIIRNSGFSNISIDLIYGLPNSTLNTWKYSLEKAMQMDVEHLSCYHLGIEDGTVLAKMQKQGKIKPVDEEQSVAQFKLLREVASEHGFMHYEISNFAKNGYISKHNSGYWLNSSYLGLGPSAHSYNGAIRRWNVASINEWKQGVATGNGFFEEEVIDTKTHFNELLMTRLRTIWGVNLNDIEPIFGRKYLNYITDRSARYIRTGFMEITPENALRILPEHYFTSDSILADLFVE